MENFYFILSTILFCCTAIIFLPLLPPRLKGIGAFVLVLLNAVATSIPSVQALAGNHIELHLYGNTFFNDVPVRIDSLSAWFILIINFTCINGALYGISYMKQYENQKGNSTLHWILFVIFHASMVWVSMLQHSLAFLFAWEIMSLSSLLLVIFEHYRPHTLKAGINYLLQMHIGVIFLSIAFMWVYFSEGSFDFEAIAAFFSHYSPIWVFTFFFLGFGIKAGFIPLHTWLPYAHPAAPSHISGVMSGVIVKLGIYGIMRTITFLNSDLERIGGAILILSLFTGFYGILNAAVHRDFKRMLAFCTIENIGIIGIGIGLGMIGKGSGNQFIMFLGFAGALIHILNHSLYKSLLFFCAGNIYNQTHTLNMEHLGGLIKKMPGTAFFYLMGALAICGLPPLNGFISEFLIYSGLIEGTLSGSVQLSSLMILGISGLAISGSISMLTFTKSFGTIFLGNSRTEIQPAPKEVSFIMRMPLYLIFSMMLLIGIFPGFVLLQASSIIPIFNSSVSHVDFIYPLSQRLNILGNVSLLLMILVLIVFLARKGFSSQRSSVFQPTWGCGYLAPNEKMQYTGKSFSKTMAKLFNFITTEKKNYQEIETDTIFPQKRKYYSHYIEFFEKLIFEKVNSLILRFFSYFSFINNGQIQRYVLYGFFFIVALLIATFFNLL